MKRIWILGAIVLTISLIWLAHPGATAASPGLAFRSGIDAASTIPGDDNPLLAAVAGEALSLYDRSLVEASALSVVLVGLVMSWALFALPCLTDE